MHYNSAHRHLRVGPLAPAAPPLGGRRPRHRPRRSRGIAQVAAAACTWRLCQAGDRPIVSCAV